MIEKGKCPICGNMNQCAITLGEEPSTCWCMTTPVPKGLLHHIPNEYRNISCVCKNCVKNYEKKICVVGSLNMDIVLNVEHFPNEGETIKAKSLTHHFGGKGGNQAIASSQLGLSTSLIGCVGSDEHGKKYLDHLKQHDIQIELIQLSEEKSGQAFIEVNDGGENKIITVGGANYSLNKSWIDKNSELILEHDVFLFSLEIPQEVVLYLMKFLHKHHKLIILDPAPFSNFHLEMLDYIDYITPNETEYEHIKTHLMPAHHVILKKGHKGSSYLHNNMRIHIPPYHVEPIDTVGAGDTFNAAFCFGLMFNYTIEESLMLANIAGGLSTTKKGAQTGMPTLKELLRIKFK